MIAPNPYRIEGHASVSFSGGRTSGYMLHEIVRAYDGVLPTEMVVVFANTGKEREETLRFVHDCGTHWGAQVRWVEWRASSEGFEEVGYNSAARNGEPFESLIAKKQMPPNWQARFCTQYLKVLTMAAFMRSLGREPGTYAEVIGLRHDEGMRLSRCSSGMTGTGDDALRRWLRPRFASQMCWPSGAVSHSILALSQERAIAICAS